MQLFKGQFYHLYNRSNNNETLFLHVQHYYLFMAKFDKLREYIRFHAYCLMPTHFHFLVQIDSPDQDPLRRKIGDILSGYTKTINRNYGRRGSLFQQHTKAKIISGNNHLISCLNYIHQNPVRAGLVSSLEDWEFSSYREYLGESENLFIDPTEMLELFYSFEDFVRISNTRIDSDSM
jgi:REP element-mobilizing transposase RayT